MALSSAEFWQRITTSQLASPMICRAWAADVAATLSASDAIEAAKVAQQLVAQGKLTQFQADTLLEDAEQKLVDHGYRLLEPVNYTSYPAPDVRSVFSGWWVAAKTPTAKPAWMRWLTVDDLKQGFISTANPSLPRVLQHAQVQHANLQVVEPPEMAGGTLQLSMQPLQGKLLTAWCDGQPKPAEMVMQLMTDIAASLAALHAVGLTHGRVAPDRICVGENGSYQLLRDPLCSLSMQISRDDSQRRSPLGLLAQKLPGKLVSAHFMAPEFLAPAQVATPQTDLYSLGCVAWLMLTGKPPQHADQAEKILAAHAERPLKVQAIESLEEPWSRCLLHCLAKNPAARFATGQQLLDSLQAARQTIAAGKQPTTVVQPTRAAVQAEARKPVVSSDKQLPAETPVQSAASTPAPTSPVPKTPAVSTPVVSTPVVSTPVVPAIVVSTPIVPTTVASTSTVPASKSSQSTAEPIKKPMPAAPTATAVPANPTAAMAKPPAVPARTSAPAQGNEPADNPPVVLPPTVPGVETVDKLPAATEPVTVSQSPVIASSISALAPATKPGPKLAAPGKPPTRRTAQRGVRKPATKRKTRNAWLTPVIGGGGLIALVLLLLVMRGGLGGGSSTVNKKSGNQNSSDTSGIGSLGRPDDAKTEVVDPLAEKFELVDNNGSVLWAPPRVAEPIMLDLLPPGAQAFVALKPATLMKTVENKQLLSLLDADTSEFWQWVTEQSGMPLESMERIVVAAYAGQNGLPQYALRVELAQSMPLSKLKGIWNLTTELKVGQQTLLIANSQAYYIAQQPLVDSQSVSSFGVGPTEMMRDTASAQGARGPLATAMEQLWQASDREAELNLLLSPAFLFTEGRSWLELAPPRLKSLVETWLPRDTRSFLFTSSLGERWFYELRMIGTSDRESLVNTQKLNDLKAKLPEQVEAWLVNETAHPHWRAMANRFPSMLRAMTTQTRVATENGQAIANGYLPRSAAANLMYATWMSVQPEATAAGPVVVAQTQTTGKPLSPAEILDRKISFSTDPVGVEVVLALIAEQANDKLPAGTKPLNFELNGTAFQLAGFTRNFQVRDYKVDNQTVRQALTLLVQRANPVQNADLKSKEQQMIWVLLDGDNPDKANVSLTSREAATQASQPLPSEFAP